MANDAQNRWIRENTVSQTIKLNKNTDADIIEWLSRQQSKMGYIKQLIRDDIQKQKAE